MYYEEYSVHGDEQPTGGYFHECGIGSWIDTGPFRNTPYENHKFSRSLLRSTTDEAGRKITLKDTLDDLGNVISSENISWLFPDDFERNRLDACRLDTVKISSYVDGSISLITTCRNMAGTVFWVNTVTTYPDGSTSRLTDTSIKYNR